MALWDSGKKNFDVCVCEEREGERWAHLAGKLLGDTLISATRVFWW